MPHPDFGITAAVDCGGGCAQGYPHAIQQRELVRAGVTFDYSISFSSVALNSVDRLNARMLWEKNFQTPNQIYKWSPEIEQIVNELLFKNIPAPFLRHHDSVREWLWDWSNYRKQYKSRKEFWADVWRVLGYIGHIVSGLPILPPDKTPSPEVLLPLLPHLLEDVKKRGLPKPQSFFDLEPLFSKLEKLVDVEKVFEDKSSTRHILARSLGGSEHVFSLGRALPAEVMYKLEKRCKIHEIRSPAEIWLALRASTAISPFFKAVRMNSGIYWDIGTINPFPAEYAMDVGCDTIFCFVRNYWADDSHDPEGDIWEREVGEAYDLSRKRFFEFYGRAVERAEKEKRKLMVFSPETLHPDWGLLGISPEAIAYNGPVETKHTRDWIRDELHLTPADD